MDVCDWLEKLGLGQYAQAFVANHIDDSSLGVLTADDLRELGVASLGHRKRLLQEISNLREDVPTSSVEGDRREVAVLFADLCFFTQLARELGAERVGEVVDSFLSRADGNDRWIYNFELENTVRGVGGYGLDVRGSVFEGMVSNSSMIGNRLGGAYFGHS